MLLGKWAGPRLYLSIKNVPDVYSLHKSHKWNCVLCVTVPWLEGQDGVNREHTRFPQHGTQLPPQDAWCTPSSEAFVYSLNEVHWEHSLEAGKEWSNSHRSYGSKACIWHGDIFMVLLQRFWKILSSPHSSHHLIPHKQFPAHSWSHKFPFKWISFHLVVKYTWYCGKEERRPAVFWFLLYHTVA